MMTTPNIVDTDLTDAALVAASLAGDREAFGLIVVRYQSLVCSLAFSATGSLTQSEDLAQEAFVAAWKTLPDLREPASLRPWLCRIARNRICDAFRGEKHEPSHAADMLDQLDEAPALEPLPHDYAISREEEAILWRAIERIPETYREPLVLFYREHQSVQCVAQKLELSEDAVKQRLSRGRKMLQDHVLAFVEGALEKTSPGKLFTLGVLAALPLAATSAKATALGSAMAVAGAGAKTAAAIGSAGGFFPTVMGVLGLYHTLKSEIEDTNSPRERQLMVRVVWIRIAFIIPYLALLYICMKNLDIRRHPLAFETAMAAFVFGVAIFVVVLFGYFDHRRLQIEANGASPTESGKSGRSSPNPSRKVSKRNVYAAAAAGMVFPLAWLLVLAMGAFRTGLWVTALLMLLLGGMCFFLAVQSWKRRPQQFINLDFAKVVQIVGLCGLITLVQYNLGHYMSGIVAVSSNGVEAVVTEGWGAVAFNAVVVLVYAAFIVIIVRKRKSELQLRSL
ncbi:MAG TPA: sigma-70 family RNA polymerase sigma factor [Verrucomicrobiae bacterium]|jgi:RNA polymerase sigma factor (sigma-70 family)|nr:sigma-70 family RNA polymerase sigma factor [Verrucomicrobiae bacterium]